VLVEGTTEVGAISVLSEMMPEPLDFDRLNCSVIEVNGKDNLPLFIKMAHALGKRVFAIYDTDSDKTVPEDQATNSKKNQAIVDAMDGKDRPENNVPICRSPTRASTGGQRLIMRKLFSGRS
jgi:predicted ATP-dependent endonuclease of OLD family